MRFWAKRVRTWGEGVAFGLGHGGSEALRAEVVAARTSPWNPDVRARLVWLGQGGS